MRFIFKLILFTAIVNIFAGVITAEFDFTTDMPQSDIGFVNLNGTGDLRYAEQQLNESLNPEGAVISNQGIFDRLLDTLSLGYYQKMINIVNQYRYGFVNILRSIFANSLNEDTSIFLFGEGDSKSGALYLITNLAYILGGWMLITGRNMFE